MSVNKKFPEVFPRWEVQHEANTTRMKNFKTVTESIARGEEDGDSVQASAIPHLLKINDLGFITNDSQDANEDATATNENQRAYVSGFYPTNLLPYLRAALGGSLAKSKTGDKMLLTTIIASDPIGDFFRSEADRQQGFVCFTNDNTVRADGKTIVRERSKCRVMMAQRVFHALIEELSDPEVFYSPGVAGLVLDPNEWSYINVFDPKWCRPATTLVGGLFADLEEALQTALNEYGGTNVVFKDSQDFSNSIPGDEVVGGGGKKRTRRRTRRSVRRNRR
jgi:hypothetical protein